MAIETDPTCVDDRMLQVGDDPDRIRAVLERSIVAGRQRNDDLIIEIPIAPDLAGWGRGEWMITDDGHAGPANEMFSKMLSEMTGLPIDIRGYAPVSAEGDSVDPQLMLLAKISNVPALS